MNNFKHTIDFKTFIFLISIMTILTVNYPRIVEPVIESSSISIFLVSIFFVIFLHLNLYKLYNTLLKSTIHQTVTKGLFYSSMIGSIAVSLVSLFLFIYVRSPAYDFHFGEELMMFGLYVLMSVYILSMVIAFVLDISIPKKNVSKSIVLLASISFYGINFIFSFILFTILSLTVGGPVFG